MRNNKAVDLAQPRVYLLFYESRFGWHLVQ
jgi:hypothetical protein